MYSPWFLLGRATTRQLALGSSKPSVKTMQFTSTCTSPDEKRDRVCLRSSLVMAPQTVAAVIPAALHASAISCATATVGQNTMPGRSEACCLYADAMSVMALESSIRSDRLFVVKSPPVTLDLSRSMFLTTTCLPLGGTR